MTDSLSKAGVLEHLRWLVGGRIRFRVEGQSMLPLLRPGDEVLITRSRGTRLRRGDLVVADHPRRAGFRLIKRVESFTPEGGVRVVGVNPDASTDSRYFGPLSREQVIGKVTSRLKKG